MKYIPVLVITLLICAEFIRNDFSFRKYNIIMFLLYLSISVVSLLFAFSLNSLGYVLLFALNMVVMECVNKYKIHVSGSVFLIVSILCMSSIPIFDGFSGGLMSIFGNANTLAIVLILPLLLLFNIRFQLNRTVFIITIVYISMLMFMTNSRSQYVFLLAFFGFYFVSNFIDIRKLKLLGILGVLFSFFIYISLMSPDINPYFVMLFDTTEKGFNLTGRDHLFEVVRSGIDSNPLGIGFGNSNAYIYMII